MISQLCTDNCVFPVGGLPYSITTTCEMIDEPLDELPVPTLTWVEYHRRRNFVNVTELKPGNRVPTGRGCVGEIISVRVCKKSTRVTYKDRGKQTTRWFKNRDELDVIVTPKDPL